MYMHLTAQDKAAWRASEDDLDCLAWNTPTDGQIGTGTRNLL